MKKLLSLLLCLMTILSLSACTYNAPEGYSKSTHSYEEVLKFAKSIDQNAIVSESYTDIDLKNGDSYREYLAVINGIECHVSSVPTLVSNEGIFASEFPRQYYRIDTDYDYLILQQIISEKQPEWTLNTNSYSYDNFLIFITTGKTEELSDEELDIVFQHIDVINSAYSSFNIRKELCFCLPSPSESYDADGIFVMKNSYSYMRDFSKNGKAEFIARYHENWALLDSDLPIRN